MKDFSDKLMLCPLFFGLNQDEILNALSFIAISKKEYRKNEYVFRLGDKMKYIAILLEGEIFLEK